MVKQKRFRVEKRYGLLKCVLPIRSDLRKKLLEKEDTKGTDWIDNFIEEWVTRLHKEAVKYRELNGNERAFETKINYQTNSATLRSMRNESEKVLTQKGMFQFGNKIVEEMLDGDG